MLDSKILTLLGEQYLEFWESGCSKPNKDNQR